MNLNLSNDRVVSAFQGYGQANQITVCVHDAKAYALRGIEAAEDSSATKLGCSNLREKQKEAIISFISGKDVLVQLQPATEVSLQLFVAMATVRISHSCDTTRSNNVLPDPLPWVGCSMRD